MILTVTLNAAMDKRYVVSSLRRNVTNRVTECQNTAGDKGLNVTKVLKQLGADVKATEIVGGSIGTYIKKQLDKEGIAHDFLEVEDESRVCINIINEEDGEQTEILEPRFTLTQTQIAAFIDKFKGLVDESEIVCISGSAPKGFDTDIYNVLIDIATKNSKKVILDTSGELLRHGIAAKPYLIKPNIIELQQLAGRQLPTTKDVKDVCDQLLAQGVQNVMVSCGKD